MPLDPRRTLTLELLQHVLMQSLGLHSCCHSSISQYCVYPILIGKVIQPAFLLFLNIINKIPLLTSILKDTFLVCQTEDILLACKGFLVIYPVLLLLQPRTLVHLKSSSAAIPKVCALVEGIIKVKQEQYIYHLRESLVYF